MNKTRRDTFMRLLPVIREGAEEGSGQLASQSADPLVDKIAQLTIAGDLAGARLWSRKLGFRRAVRMYDRLLSEMADEGKDVTEWAHAFAAALGGRDALAACWTSMTRTK
jgi:hypothetical protein